MTPECEFPECGKLVRILYPGNDPENGPARPYCADGHSTCYRCGEWFQAKVTQPATVVRYDEDVRDDEPIEIPESVHESDLCASCAREQAIRFCSCGSDPKHRHDVWACCGSSMCCPNAEE